MLKKKATDTKGTETNLGTLLVDLHVSRPDGQEDPGSDQGDPAVSIGNASWGDQEAPATGQSAVFPPVIHIRTGLGGPAVFCIGLMSAAAVAIAYRDAILVALGG